MSEYIIKGLVEVQKMTKSLVDFKKTFDSDLQKIVIETSNNLKNTTPRGDFGIVRDAWKTPKRKADCNYEIINDRTSQDKKHAIAEILNSGRGEVYPVDKKVLYIPISRRAKQKKVGDEIPDNFEFGRDYVLTKKAKAYKGTQYIDKEIKKTTDRIQKSIIDKVDKL